MVKTIYLHMGCLLFLFVAQGCKPELDDRTFLVEDARILAIQADPPEAKPGERVHYRLLWAEGTSRDDLPALEWSHCLMRKPLAELGPIHPACLSADPTAHEPLGSGFAVSGEIPRQTCRRFGPDLPEPKAGEPAGRPVDPDGTGGFYQPVIVRTSSPEGDAFSLGRTRVSCGVAGATPEQLAEMARTYLPNQNPRLEGIEMLRGSGWEVLTPGDPPSQGNTVHAGETVVIRATLPSCENAPCEGAETYTYFDPQERSVATAEELVQLSWFATAGYFPDDRTGLSPDSGLGSENTWTAPEQEGLIRLWIVARDNRGGVGWEELLLRVAPR